MVFVVTAGWLVPMLPTQADPACHERARTAYEKLYCTVQERGAGGNLPRFEDFQRNNERIQASLLKGPAQKLGLTLPEPRQPRQASVAKPKPTPPAKPKPQAQPVVAAVSKTPVTLPARNEDAFSLASCRLQGEAVRCGSDIFQLAVNLPNSALPAGALGDGNTFGLQDFNGNVTDEAALRRYLSASYRHYIVKMLDIGLGDATMSYTKFYYTFMELVNKQENFAERFETMYHYLKRDKATMAIKPRYQSRLPESIAQCQMLSDSVVVCDDKTINWVFVRS